MRESRTYGSVRGAYDETHVPTATLANVRVPDPDSAPPASTRMPTMPTPAPSR